MSLGQLCVRRTGLTFLRSSRCEYTFQLFTVVRGRTISDDLRLSKSIQPRVTNYSPVGHSLARRCLVHANHHFLSLPFSMMHCVDVRPVCVVLSQHPLTFSHPGLRRTKTLGKIKVNPPAPSPAGNGPTSSWCSKTRLGGHHYCCSPLIHNIRAVFIPPCRRVLILPAVQSRAGRLERIHRLGVDLDIANTACISCIN